MNEKSRVFSKLLPINELFALYEKLSKSIITKIDVKSLGYDSSAVDNSINLLINIGMIFFDEKGNSFQRIVTENFGITEFSKELYLRLQSACSDVFDFVNHITLLFDESEGKLYIKRNSVSLELSGLLMLLDGLEKVRIAYNNIFILDEGILSKRKEQSTNPFHYRTLAELHNQLEKNERYGIDAELAAMKYETELLESMGINKSPERISEYNTSAGYDIVSFVDSESAVPDKFIEVKSCSDNTWTFYFSKNELETAKIKQDNYYLYLFNRKNQKFRIIKNPYSFFIHSEAKSQWTMEPQIYQIKSLEGLL